MNIVTLACSHDVDYKHFPSPFHQYIGRKGCVAHKRQLGKKKTLFDISVQYTEKVQGE